MLTRVVNNSFLCLLPLLALVTKVVAIRWLWPLLWPWDSLTDWRDPPPPGLALVELLLVSTVWGREWYFLVLKLIGRRRREEENTKAEGEEVGNTADDVDRFLASFNGCFEWLRNDTRSFTKAEYVFQCIIIWLQCSDMDNYHHFKKSFNPLFFSFFFLLYYYYYSYFMDHKVLSTTGFGNYFFHFVIIFFILHQSLQVIAVYLLRTTPWQIIQLKTKIALRCILMHELTTNAAAVPGEAKAGPREWGCPDLAQRTPFLSMSGNLSADPCGHFVKQSPKFQAL